MCLTVKASVVWKSLSGLLCLYKPAGQTTESVMKVISTIVSKGLRKMKTDPPRKIVHLDSDGVPLDVVDTDYSDHPLVVGPRVIPQDFKLRYCNYLGPCTSGVLVFGVNKKRHLADGLIESKPLRVYRLTGELGVASSNLFSDGKIVERATFSNVHRPVIDKVVAAMQASHQRSMFMQCGVSLQSQAAYELAIGGLIRPGNDYVPTIYGMKCLSFERPFFSIEVSCINETEEYLMKLIHTIGLKCRSAARCVKIRCIRYGPFTVNDALLRHDWNALNFARNIEKCMALDEVDRHSKRRESAYFIPVTSTDSSKPETTSRKNVHSQLIERSSPISSTGNIEENKTVVRLLSRHYARRRLKRMKADLDVLKLDNVNKEIQA